MKLTDSATSTPRSPDHLALTAEQRAEALPSGLSRLEDRIGWATSDLARAEALSRPSRGHYRITDLGRRLLTEHPEGLTEKVVRTLPAYVASMDAAKASRLAKASAPTETAGDQSPAESIEAAIQEIHVSLADELLDRLHAREPAFFEQAVLDLLMAMGYGGADGTATRTQLSNDGGIDGVIDQDALGLSRVHVQAKRYAPTTPIGRPDIQAFVGAMAGSQANQGVFITTGRFSQGARAYADSVPTRVVLIDGPRMAALMIKYGVGVQVKRTLHIVEIDEDFFE